MNAGVWLPGHWWHSLTYDLPEETRPGCRVAVPLGRRQALTIGLAAQGGVESVKGQKTGRLLDPVPVLSPSSLAALERCSRSWLCGPGTLARYALPSPLWRGDPWPAALEKAGTGPEEYVARYGDDERLEAAIEALKGRQGNGLVLVPDGFALQVWKKRLAELFGDRLICQTGWSGKKAFETASRLASEEDLILLTGPSGALAPLAAPAVLVVEDQPNGAYVPQKGPSVPFSALALERFRFLGARRLLLARAPDGAAVTSWRPAPVGRPKREVSFLDTRRVQRWEIKGFEFPLPLAKPLVRATVGALSLGQTVLWLLDRRAYAGGLRCVSCGEAVSCPRCDGPLASQGGRCRCGRCGYEGPIPDRCPCCGSQVMQFRTPGLEALVPLAQSLCGRDRVHLWCREEPASVSEQRRICSSLKESGGLVLGSRRALELASLLPLSVIAWLDGDGEARQADYNSAWRAYSMTLESLCRGGDEARRVFLQTRRPLKGWQAGLNRGWSVFWNSELIDRQGLGFPPFTAFVRLRWPEGKAEPELITLLEQRGFEPFEEDGGMAVLTDDLEALYEALAPRFSIANSRLGYPQITLRH